MKKDMQNKWVQATPILCVIAYFLLAFILDKYTNVNKPYVFCLLVFLFIPLSYYIVGLKKFRFIYPLFITIMYLGICSFLDGLFGIKLWHPLWVLLLTVPIYYIFKGEDKITINVEEVKEGIKKKVKNTFKYNAEDCDFDSDDN